MTRNEDLTTGESAQGAAGTGARRAPSRSRSGRPARVVMAAAAALAAGGLLAGCGGKGSDASDKTGRNAAPAGSSHKAAGSSHKTADGAGTEIGGTGGGSGSGGSTGGGLKTSGSASSKSGSAGKGSAHYGSGTSGSVCTAEDLKGAIGPNHPGAGQENFALVLTNKSGSTCTVHGFPGFAFLNSDGDQVSLDPERDGSGATTRTVELSPGKSAWAPLSYTNPEMTDVPTVTPDSALITPPDQRASLRVDWSGGPVSATGKASVPKIGPLSAGTGS
ncbi:DUF4232 domain-containing protein [Streptomyces sp. 3N207]|uniref:DUF4232 domain-containing protein n=1 Tax=Streptomyces sp. 3N207 TaxID=3457417 RepID=UPI003FD640CD